MTAKTKQFIKEFDDNLLRHKELFTREEWEEVLAHIVGSGFTALWYFAGRQGLRDFFEDCIAQCEKLNRPDTLKSTH